MASNEIRKMAGFKSGKAEVKQIKLPKISVNKAPVEYLSGFSISVVPADESKKDANTVKVEKILAEQKQQESKAEGLKSGSYKASQAVALSKALMGEQFEAFAKMVSGCNLSELQKLMTEAIGND